MVGGGGRRWGAWWGRSAAWTGGGPRWAAVGGGGPRWAAAPQGAGRRWAAAALPHPSGAPSRSPASLPAAPAPGPGPRLRRQIFRSCRGGGPAADGVGRGGGRRRAERRVGPWGRRRAEGRVGPWGRRRRGGRGPGPGMTRTRGGPPARVPGGGGGRRGGGGGRRRGRGGAPGGGAWAAAGRGRAGGVRPGVEGVGCEKSRSCTGVTGEQRVHWGSLWCSTSSIPEGRTVYSETAEKYTDAKPGEPGSTGAASASTPGLAPYNWNRPAAAPPVHSPHVVNPGSVWRGVGGEGPGAAAATARWGRRRGPGAAGPAAAWAGGGGGGGGAGPHGRVPPRAGHPARSRWGRGPLLQRRTSNGRRWGPFVRAPAAHAFGARSCSEGM